MTEPATFARARAWLEEGRVVVLAGAGLLRCAGLEPPEAPGGLWDRHDPLRCAVPSALDATPAQAWRAFAEYLKRAREAAGRPGGPSVAHRCLWDLEQRGWLRGVIAVSTAGLVRASGVERVAEFFGAIDRLRCRDCHVKLEAPEGAERTWATGVAPRCHTCGGRLRPDLVLFEESMPRAPRAKAAQWVYGGRTLMILGANIRKPPMRNIPLEMRQEGGRILALGDVEPSMLKRVRGLWIKGDLNTTLPQLFSER
ncbi:MAG: Sir2 family NAD-dependent protein deacetylase [Myxococcota bacterium]